MFSETILAITSLYLAFLIQYIAVTLRTYSVPETHIPLSLREFIQNTCDKSNLQYRFWKDTDRNIMVMATFYMPPLTPIIVFDKKVFLENIEVAKVFLAHELGHVRRKSQLKLFITASLLLVVIFNMSYISELASLLMFLAMIVIILTLYRYEEFKADEYAASKLGLERVLNVYMNLASKQTSFKIRLYKNPVLVAVAVLKKLKIYPSIEDRVKNLMEKSSLISIKGELL